MYFISVNRKKIISNITIMIVMLHNDSDEISVATIHSYIRFVTMVDHNK